MANILLDYFFKITSITPTPAASTAFLKQVCVVVKPKGGYMGAIGGLVVCTTNAQIAAVTDNTEAQQLLAAGMSKVYLMPVNDLYLADFLEGHESDFYTLLISNDFTEAEVIATQAAGSFTITSYANLVSGTDDVISVAGVAFTAQTGAAVLGEATFQAATDNNATAASLRAQINAHPTTSALVTAGGTGAQVTITANDSGSGGNAIALGYTDNDTNVGATKSGTVLTGGDGLFLGEFTGVVGISSDDMSFLQAQAVIENRCAFYESGTSNAKNMMYAFGKLLSNSLNWLNQQYITMPFADDVDSVGDAEALFEDKISFVMDDTEFGKRLGLFCAGGKAIVAPYVKRNLEIDLQSKALSYVSGNMPAYTVVQASLLEDELTKVMQSYIDRQWIENGTVEIKLEQENFVASGYINIAEPGALWRIFGEIRQTL